MKSCPRPTHSHQRRFLCACILACSLWAAAALVARGATTPPAFTTLPLVFEANRGQIDDPVRFIVRRPGHTLLLTPEEALLLLDTRAGSLRTIRLRFEGARPHPQIDGQQELRGKVHYLVGQDPRAWRTQIPLFAQVAYRQLYPSVDLILRSGHGDLLEYDFTIGPGGDPSKIALRFDGARQVQLNKDGDLRLITDEGVLVQRKPVAYQLINGKRREVASRFVMRAPGLIGFKVGTYDSRATLVIDPPFEYSTYIGGDGTDRVNGIATDTQGNVYVTGMTNSLAGSLPLDFPTKNPFPGGEQLGTYPLPPPDPRPHPLARKLDAFIGKLDTTQAGANSLVYMSFFGGGLGDDQGFAIAVDAIGRAHIGGLTSSSDLPLVNPLQSCRDASNTYVCDFNVSFLARLSASGSALEYSSYLNGSNVDEVRALAIGPQNRLYVGGRTASPISPSLPVLPGTPNYFAYFPITATALQPTNHGIFDAFVMVLNLATPDPAQQLVYSTLLGGCADDEVQDLGVNALGHAVVTGTTQAPCSTLATRFPMVNSFQPTYAGGLTDAFVAEIDPALIGAPGLLFSTFLGGKDDENDLRKSGLALDAAGNIFVAGTTSSANFPTTLNAAQRCPGMNAGNAATYPCDPVTGQFSGPLPPNGVVIDGYMSTFSSSGQLLHSTFLGGAGQDSIQDVAVRPDGSFAYAVGSTTSTGLGSSCAPQPQLSLGRDAFEETVRLVPAGGGFSSTLAFYTYVGGGSDDFALGAAFDSLTKSVFVGGYTTFNTSTKPFPTTANALQPAQPGSSSVPYDNGFLSQIKDTVCAPNLVLTKVGTPEPASPGCGLTYTLEVQNTGILSATQVVVTDLVPAPVTISSATSTQGTCSGASPVVCSIGTLSPGQKATMTLLGGISPDYAPTQPPLLNTASATSFEADADPSDNSASWTTHLQINYPSYSVGNPAVIEGNTGTKTVVFTVTLAQSACVPLPFSFTTATVNDPAVAAQPSQDFVAANGSFSIPAGAMTHDVPVTVVSDIQVEPDEIFQLAVSAGFPGPVSSAVGTATIVNDDLPPSVSITGPTLVNEGSTQLYSFIVIAAGPFTVGTASCGSGTLVGAVTTTQDPSGGGTGSFSCLFPKGPASTQVQIQVQGGGALSNVASVGVTVANVAPVVTLTGPVAVASGETATYQFSVTDAGGDSFLVSPGYPVCGAQGTLVNGSLIVNALGGMFQCLFGIGPASSQVAVQANDSDGANSNVAALTVDIGAPIVQSGWMVGQGTLTSAAGTVHIALSLSCQAGQGPKNLQVMVGPHHFKLDQLTTSGCTNDPAIDPGAPATVFDTLAGTGSGKYDNVTGYQASFTLKDAGEPGTSDSVHIVITNAQNVIVLDVTGPLATGNINTQQ